MKYVNAKTVVSVIVGAILARLAFKYAYQSDIPVIGDLWEY